MTLCKNCGRHIVFAPSMPDHPWRHESTGFRQCEHGREFIWAEPVPMLEPVEEEA